ncbi:unnamed protein product [Oikopleura dioica]|uniref:Uncharacterized protein n=1 Tax=Oikopleura dioica TaxID=34765 RepID=E4YLN0_OIKDI|nr:unnamed protein product [Oikopleura dioica]
MDQGLLPTQRSPTEGTGHADMTDWTCTAGHIFIPDLASFASSGSIEIPFYNANGTPAIPDEQAPAPSTYQDIPAPDYSTS